MSQIILLFEFKDQGVQKERRKMTGITTMLVDSKKNGSRRGLTQQNSRLLPDL